MKCIVSVSVWLVTTRTSLASELSQSTDKEDVEDPLQALGLSHTNTNIIYYNIFYIIYMLFSHSRLCPWDSRGRLSHLRRPARDKLHLRGLREWLLCRH